MPSDPTPPEPIPGSPPAPVRQGIAIVANDKVLHWLVPFLESWKATNAALPVFLIPYDDNCAQTRRVAEIYGVTVSDVDSAALDALSRRLYPLGFVKRNRLRKLLSLVLPLDEVIYLDVDIILFNDLRNLLGLLEPGKTDFIVIAETLDYVYNQHRADYDNLRDAVLFNDGFFITSNTILSIQDFYDVIERDEKIFHRVRERGGLYAQPLTNFVVHRKGLKIVSAFEKIPSVSAQSYHKAENVTFDADGPRDEWGGRIYFCHWPGVNVPSNLVFDAAWHDYAQRGKERLAKADLVRQPTR